MTLTTLQQASTPLTRKTDWKLWEADILVECGLKHRFITVYIPRSGATHQSFLHGFDLQSSQLLLDGLFPWPTNPLAKGERFWIQIRCEHGFYNMELELLEAEGHRGGELLTVSVLHAGLTHNRRWHTRVYFDTRQGPEVELQLDEYPLLHAHVANLSRCGALLEIYGKDIKASSAKRTFIGRFKFNDHFHLPLECVIKQNRFLRSPCCHTQLRVQFTGVGEDQQAQLDTFIHAIAAPLPTHLQTFSLAAAS